MVKQTGDTWPPPPLRSKIKEISPLEDLLHLEKAPDAELDEAIHEVLKTKKEPLTDEAFVEIWKNVSGKILPGLAAVQHTHVTTEA